MSTVNDTAALSLDEQIELAASGDDEKLLDLIFNPFTHSHVLNVIFECAPLPKAVIHAIKEFHPNSMFRAELEGLTLIKNVDYWFWVHEKYPQVMCLLTYNTDPGVRVILAKHKSTCGKCLSVLASTDSRWSRILVAQNPATPESVLMKITKEGDDEEIIRAVASNPSISPEIANLLFKMNDSTILEKLAVNTNTPPHLLKKLTRHQSEHISFKALQTLGSYKKTRHPSGLMARIIKISAAIILPAWFILLSFSSHLGSYN